MSKLRLMLAEALGTFALVLLGCGAIVIDQISGGGIGHVGISIIFGLVVMAMIYSVGNVSGAHLNPAVSLAFAVAGRIPYGMAGLYMLAQLAGALLAAGLLVILFPEHLAGVENLAGRLGDTHPSGTVLQAVMLEVVISFILMFVIFNVSSGHKEEGMMAGVAVGGSVAMLAMLGGLISGASMNPARSLGPAVFSGALSDQWIYIVGPVLGMLLACPTCRWIQGPECCQSEE